jgi:uncharacterized membrane protein
MAFYLFNIDIFPAATAFLFIFAIVFALLVKSNVLGNKNASGAVAFAIAAFTAMVEPVVSGLQQYLPVGAVLLTIIFFFVFLRDAAGIRGGQNRDMLPTAVVLVISMLLLATLGMPLLNQLQIPEAGNLLWITGITLVGLIFYAIYKHPQ